MIETAQTILAQSSFVTKLLYSIAIVSGLFGAVAIQRIAYIWTQQHIDMVIERIHSAELHLQSIENQRHQRIIEALRTDHETSVHMPDANGYVGIPRSIVENPQNAAALLTYNLHNSYHRRNRKRSTYRYNNTDGPQEEAPQLTDEGGFDAVKIRQAITQGLIRPGQVYLGTNVHTGDHLVLSSVTDIRGMGVVGQSGAGKSNLTRLIASQVVAAGGVLLVIDPHFGSEESTATSLGHLQQSMLFQPAVDDDEILGMVQAMTSTIDKRMQYSSEQLEQLPYMLLICDELNNVMRRPIGKEAAQEINRVLQEARKVRMGALLIGQSFRSTSIKNDEMRDALTNRIALRCSSSEAARMIDSTEFTKNAMRLPKGHALIFGNMLGEEAHIAMPKCDMEDVKIIAPKSSIYGTSETLHRPFETPSEQPSDEGSEGQQRRDFEGPSYSSNEGKPEGGSDGPIYTAKEYQIYQAMQNEVPISHIMRDILGGKGKGGDEYKEQRKTIREVAQKFGMEDSKYG